MGEPSPSYEFPLEISEPTGVLDSERDSVMLIALKAVIKKDYAVNIVSFAST